MFGAILKAKKNIFPERYAILSYHLYEKSYEATCIHI